MDPFLNFLLCSIGQSICPCLTLYLRCNLYEIKCTGPKDEIQCILTNAYIQIPHTAIKIANISITQNDALCLSQSPTLTPSQKQQFFWFPSHWFALPVLKLHVIGIIQYVLTAFYLLWLSTVLLQLIHVAACTSSLFLFMNELYFLLWICHSFVTHSLLSDI